MKKNKAIIGISMGDCNGIGPEVALKAVLDPSVRKICNPVLIGSTDVFALYAKSLKRRVTLREVTDLSQGYDDSIVMVMNPFPFTLPRIQIGKITKEGGRLAGDAITVAAELCMERQLDAMVTAPVSKEAMRLAGYQFPGQTEMVAHLTGSTGVMMMLLAGNFRVALATIHIPVKNVSSAITKRLIMDCISSIYLSLQKDFGVVTPKIAVLGLNPHAGENGLIGKEEQAIIKPAISAAKKKYNRVDGPFPADGFFGKHSYKQYDAVLAMYHDQGLIPLKMMGFDIGVNFSAGLPIVRTSPDHGTAFDIAGKGIANPSSTIEAIKTAVNIVQNRKKAAQR